MLFLKRIAPYFYCLLSFAVVIMLGSIIFYLPISYESHTSPDYIDALFLSASSVCVTGLSPFATGLDVTLSLFGKISLMVLISIGGLGFITIYYYILTILGVKFGFQEKFLLRQSFNFENFSGLFAFIKKIIIITISIEVLFSIINCFIFIPIYGWDQGILVSIFHAISAFNNAGFDLFGNSSMIQFATNVPINIITMTLIFLGGIGFPVIIEIINKKSLKNLSAYTRIVLTSTIILILFGTLGFKVTEGHNMTWLQALFQSITCRTAGFATYDQANLSYEGAKLSQLLMLVGASPLSTGGGIKTTTIFTIFILIASYLSRTHQTIAFNRKISRETISKSITLLFVAIILINIAFTSICLIERKYNPELTHTKILFECYSAFGTVGLSQGITSSLASGSKILLTLLMYIGRVGPMTLIAIITNVKQEHESHIDYVEANVIIG